MLRTVLGFTAMLCCLSPASATLVSRTVQLPADDNISGQLAGVLAQDKPLPDQVLQAIHPRERNDEYAVTSQTTVFLDGQPCRYADVPRKAVIVNMQISSDDRSVLAIYFRSKK
jgi:hypothetical protein